MKSKLKILAMVFGGILLLGALLTAGWIWRFRTLTPATIKKDFQAAMGARHSPQPALKFLELRYGPLDDPANRQKAFLEFFNQDHVEGLYRIVQHSPSALRQTNIAVTAKWIADYREHMTPEEKVSLRERLNSPEVKMSIQHATSFYLARDVNYRAAVAPVIRELVSTLAAVQQP